MPRNPNATFFFNSTISGLFFKVLSHIIKAMRKKRSKSRYVRTTVSLPEDVWKELKIESIEKRITLGELIVEKLKELEELKSKMVFVEPPQS